MSLYVNEAAATTGDRTGSVFYMMMIGRRGGGSASGSGKTHIFPDDPALEDIDVEATNGHPNDNLDVTVPDDAAFMGQGLRGC